MASSHASSAGRQPAGQLIPWWLLTLYRKPVLFLSLALALPVALLCAWMSTVNERLCRAQEEHHLVIAAQLASRVLQDELAQTRQMETAFAARPDFIAAMQRRDRTVLASELRLLLSLLPSVDRAVLLDPAGRPLASASAGPADPEEPAFEEPLAADGSWEPHRIPVSGVYLRDSDSGEKAVGIATAIRAGDEPLGVLQVQYRLQELARWLQRIRLEPDGYLYVADQRGRLVAHPFQLLPGAPKNVSAWAPVAMEASSDGTLIHFSQGRPPRPWTAAVVVVEPYGWRVVSQQPDAAMLRPFRRLVGSFTLLIIVLAGLLAGLVLRWSSLHRATLNLLAQQARLLKWSERRHLLATLRRKPTRRHGLPEGRA